MTHDATSQMIDTANDGDSRNWSYQNVPIMDEIEDLDSYRPGGFAPVSIGDTLDKDRFEIIYKLGYGGIAMVWLCWETEAKRWRAIKINSASHSSEECGDLKAIKLMKENGVSEHQLEENHVAMALETFFIDTPNGRHLCTVLPVFGPRAHDWRTEELQLDGRRTKNICYQITKGLSFLHNNGLCHGDFRPQNVLMKLRPGSLDELDRDGMWELLGEPELADVWTTSGTRSIHAPNCVVTSAPWQRFRDFVTDEVVIVDFGEAYLPSDPPRRFGIPTKYAAPEVLFEKGRPGLASDIWSLAITLLELRLDDYGYDAPYPVIRKMERFVGPIPVGYRHAAKRLLEHADDDKDKMSVGNDDHLAPLTGSVEIPLDEDEEREFSSATFSDRLEMKLASEQLAWGEEIDPRDPDGKRKRPKLLPYYLPDDEVRELADLLHSMLRYDPKQRISVSQVLRHPWFRTQHGRDPLQYWRYAIVGVVSLIFLACSYWLWPGLSWDYIGGTNWCGRSPITVIYLA
ncbi:kinase-like domain-containing protein [Nemania sp. FL0031]|nr:kinase-like domain-containing protein [Nemania sp. FL0031]